MTFGLYLLLNLALVSILVIWLRRLVLRRLAPERVLQDLHGEIQTLVAEVNQTSDHNISIIEDRIASLRELVHNADRQIEELERLLQHISEGKREEIYALPLPAARREPPTSIDGSPQTVDVNLAAETNSVGETVDEERRDVVAAQDADEKDLRSSVIELHEQGLSTELISSHTGIAIGEVELIISLMQGRARR